MKAFRILWRLLCLLVMFALAACGSPIPNDTPQNELPTCQATYSYKLTNHRWQVAKQFTFEGTFVWEKGTDEWFYLKPQDKVAWSEFVESTHSTIDRLNHGLSQVYYRAGFIPAPYAAQLPEFDYISKSADTQCPTYAFEHEWRFTHELESDGYTTTSRVQNKITYINIRTKGGSELSYSIPTSYLDNIFTFTLDKGEAFQLEAQFTTPEVASLDDTEYARTMLDQLFAAEQSGREALSFTLNVSDYEGRQELRPAIIRAMIVGAAQEGKPVTASLHAFLSNGTRAVATTSIESDSLRTHQWWLFSQKQTSDEHFQYQSSYQSWYEDVVRGSVYIFRQQ